MERKGKKRVLLYTVLVLLFLAAIPSVAFRAGTAPAGSSSGYEERYLGGDATIESVREMLADANGWMPAVVATGPDGVPRTSGPIREGDLVEIIDARGELVNAFLNVRPSGEGSSAESGGNPSSSRSGSSSKDPRPEGDASSQEGPGNASPGESSSETSPAPGVSSGGYYLFEGPVTVAALEERISGEGTPGSVLTVLSASGAVRLSGPVCTGDVLTVRNDDGSLQSRIVAVIPGDLTRCGSAAPEGCRVLYDYLTGLSVPRGDVLRAADLNGDGRVTTGDLLELKKMLYDAG